MIIPVQRSQLKKFENKVERGVLNSTEQRILINWNLFSQGSGLGMELKQVTLVDDLLRDLDEVPPPADGTEEVAVIRLSGGQGKIDEKKQVLIEKARTGTFIQTDKAIYSPGQEVLFRIITLDSGFNVLNKKYQLVELQDPAGNRIAQWRNVEPEQGIVQLSVRLANEPMFGTYEISVDNRQATLSFVVMEYVLPKFEVKVVEPTKIFSADGNFPLKVCGSYTYGKPVQGLLQVSLCQKAYQFYWRPLNTAAPTDICQDYSSQTDKTGCFSVSVELSQFRPLSYDYSRSIDLVAILEEAGTGVQANTTLQIPISSQLGSMSFVETDNYYYPGYPFSGKLKALQKDGSILKNHKVFLFINFRNERIKMPLTTDSNGVAAFTLDTDSWSGMGVSLQGTLQLQEPVYSSQISQTYENANLYLTPFYTTTKSYVKIQGLSTVLPCNQKQEIQVDYNISNRDLEEQGQGSVVIFSYYVTRKGQILVHGQKTVKSKGGALQGSFSILLTFNSDFAPQSSLVVYSLFSDGGVIADKTTFVVSMCFKNQVSLGLPQQQELPGSNIDLTLKAAPGSLCAVRAVDQSVFLLKEEQELSKETVYGMFDFSEGYPYQVSEYDYCFEPFQPWWRRRRSVWRPQYDFGIDLFSFLKEMGLKVMSNYKIKKSASCSSYPFYGVTSAAMPRVFTTEAYMALPSPSPDQPFESQVRQLFPETWLWGLYPVGVSGTKQVPVTVPDSITEWKLSMFCTSQSHGFGISPAVGLTAFKPFFVDVTMPYSVIRGESFPLIASVFSYMKQCIQIQITLYRSEDYEVQLCKGCKYTSCLCTNEAKTFSWNIRATKLGMVNFTLSTETLNHRVLCGSEQTIVPEKGQQDILIKPLLVQPEGVLVEKSHSSLLCSKGALASDSFSLQLPEDVVPDSSRAQVSVIGDIMGMALQNLDKLVKMPSGCGEQNMVLFAPIISVLQYLQSTGQLNEELKTKAMNYLQSGYQRELQYKHSDGSYSAFGPSDGQGNTWLTAFVTKCFIQAKQFIFIDERNIQASLEWLRSNQLPTGCFANVGRLLHTAMKGGVNDEVSLAAYIIAALLEAQRPLEDPMVKEGLNCLRKAVSSTTDVYTQALLAYVFSLAGDTVLRQKLLAKLDQQAIKLPGGQIYWSRKPASTPSQTPWSQPESVSVELTGYVLLATVTSGKVIKEDIGKATGIVNWLVKQQNAYGGFASTQDTVVALQALARYGAVTYVGSGELSIIVKSKTFQQSFHVDNTNQLLLQLSTLPDIPGEYTVQASGEGCVYIQAILRYNMPPLKTAETFSLTVEAEGQGCEIQTVSRFITLNINVSYVGNRGVSNMAIIEVKMMSGFYPAQGTKYFLEQQPLVKKVEFVQEYVNIYLDQVGKKKQSYTFNMSQDILVKELKPATVKVYDYYQPDETATVEYEDPCQ
ncbi:alpha-2-macroglobulin-like protein 1 [Python bivittatus]|uniref:Alpha-2-macroglobulin-like protein 1 n=1 Tax=Python bivittatus TaxID=176946 RepID=A0A9F5J820_PYTBI|nr:alpha-2-macroglobulin-like protein 1 [Python bivittatus]